MKRKEVADVMGGKDEWANADSMASEYTLPLDKGCMGRVGVLTEMVMSSAMSGREL